jgi:hypothetical protein
MSLLAPDAAAPRLVRAPAAVVAPVPPLPTVNAVLSVNALNVGELVVAMSWMVFTAPLDTVKFVELNDAIPLAAVVALSIVMVAPAAEALATDSAPVSPFSDVTPLPEAAQVGHVMLPFASREIIPLAETAIVPDAFGRV